MLERRTKIVATLGPATDAPGVLDRLVAAGMDCARLNCSHGDADALKRRAAEVRDAAQRCGRPLGLLFDLQGPKLRLNGDTAEQMMQTGDTITFSEDGPGPGRVIVDFVGFSRLVTERSQVLVIGGPASRASRSRPSVPARSTAARSHPGASRRARASTSRTRAPSCPRSRRRTPSTSSSRSSSKPTSSPSPSSAPPRTSRSSPLA